MLFRIVLFDMGGAGRWGVEIGGQGHCLVCPGGTDAPV